MRRILVNMLDGIGLQDALGIDSTDRLFGSHHHLAAHVSAIDYSVFLKDRNYTGVARHLFGMPFSALWYVLAWEAGLPWLPRRW
jgi:hypothetical protein